MFKDQLECYQAIANDLISLVSDPWSKIQIEALRTSESSMNMVITTYLNDGNEASLKDVGMLPFHFDELAGLVSTPEKGLYKKCIFTLHNDGKYDTEFDYS